MSNQVKIHWKNDIIAGFVVFLIALPLSLGIAIASGAPASAGLLSAILGGILGTLITGNHIAINGPAAGLIVVIAGSIQRLGQDDLLLGLKRTLAATIIAGALQILVGIFRLGLVAFLAPSAVVHGMLSAIGLIIMIKQIPIIFGVIPQSKDMIGLISEIPNIISQANLPVTLIGMACLFILLIWSKGLKKLSKIIPAPLLAVAIGLILGGIFHFSNKHMINWHGHAFLVGPTLLVKVPDQFKSLFIFPIFDSLFTYQFWLSVLSIFLIGSIESLLSSYAVDKLDPYHRKSDLNKDILGKGIINICCGLLGAYPIITEIVRSSANIENGAKTKWSNFFHGFFILVFVGFFPDLINKIPLSALGAVLFLVGFSLAHPKHFKETYKHGFDQFIFFITTLAITILEDLLIGVAAGILLKIVIHLYRGVKLKDFLSPKFDIKENDNTYLVEVKSNLVFLNYLKVKKTLDSLNKNKSLEIRNDDNFIDHTISEVLEDYKKNYPEVS